MTRTFIHIATPDLSLAGVFLDHKLAVSAGYDALYARYGYDGSPEMAISYMPEDQAPADKLQALAGKAVGRLVEVARHG